MNIDKTIPIPSRGGKWTELARRMEIGDSVFVPTASERSMLASAINTEYGTSAITRREATGFRVWRSENKKTEPLME